MNLSNALLTHKCAEVSSLPRWLSLREQNNLIITAVNLAAEQSLFTEPLWFKAKRFLIIEQLAS